MIIHTGQVVIDLGMQVPALPDAGSDVFASSSQTGLGGGFPVMVAARGVGGQVDYCGALGSGPWSDHARTELDRYGINHSGPTCDGDIGVSIVLTDDRAERTFVSHRGVEALDMGQPQSRSSDLVYVTGYSFVHPKAEKLRQFLSQTESRIVIDVSPLVENLSDADLELLSTVVSVWSMNEREAGLLQQRFGHIGDTAENAIKLAQHFGVPVLVRCGADGSIVASKELNHIDALPVQAIDTNGAGDVYTGVICGLMDQGYDLIEACRYASVAGSLSTTRRGAIAQYSVNDLAGYLNV